MAKNKMRLQIITPMKTILDEEVDSVILSTTEGEMGILYDHEPVVVLLGYKTLSYTQDEVKKYATTLGGFAEITKDKIVVLTDASEFADEIDLERAKRAKERAEKRLSDSNMDHLRAEIALKKAIARINLKEGK
ncbi:F0F1 ATP synthase subunit epsilon [Cellulosilyticum lentocellum]|uniref:ATP synthase epsilon chain n=1 Tax=Cellulosilyticum lentocellum (strain ATCC 49066 / DSM 5427 / NCIMB 11756 / RHM5) TaxID=642492 RepID=F2JGW1_CELLD|nr:F0F1 ATP synthase subunit epsilon [Cellulosilyticum lentocellum]ADZ85301.1 ATP synthase F1, epsilon subunit [Cellulosilyticum lentocellum DSM 5427]